MTDVRAALLDHARKMIPAGLNEGTAGNLSVRAGHGFWITPTGMDYAALHVDDLVFVHADGRSEGRRRPSSEWRFHHDIYLGRPEAGAVLHAHSPFATALACLRRELPAFHYMLARFGGDSVRCADYASFGTQALSDAVLVALAERSACLLANHGMLVFAADLPQALAQGIELETLCAQYARACALGAPVLLPADEMQRMVERFRDYGRQAAQADDTGA